LGALIALAGNLHVHLIMAFARRGRTLMPRPAVRAAIVGGAVGFLAWYAPNLVGTGEAMTQSVLDGRLALSTLGAVFLVRFVLGPLSLAASTPGGYFTPVLLLGATFGDMVGILANLVLPVSDVTPTAFAVVGMAVALAWVANAPFTGILLVIETTGAVSLSLPMMVAVLGALGVGRLLKQPSLTHGLEIALRPVKGAGDSPSGRPAA
jgi:CIC family chloride channel protein